MFELSPQQGAAVKRIRSWFRNETVSKQTFVMCGFAGTGKQAPLDTTLQTPYGPLLMGNVKLGDAVFGVDGRPVEVVGIFPQGIKPCFKITFRDGTSTRCGPDHLWTVFEGSAAFERNYSITLTTQEMIDKGVRRPCGLMRFRTPLNAAVQYAPSDSLPIDPWLLGTLLGDGSMCNGRTVVSINNEQADDLEDRIQRSLPAGVTTGSRSAGSGCYKLALRGEGVSNSPNPLMLRIRELGLAVKGGDKFVPDCYLYASIEDRYEILRGLMDSDGSIKGNRVAFHSHSTKLANGVAELVRSLGGTAVVREQVRVREGVTKTEYSVNVKTLENPFWLPCKANQWEYSWKNPPSKYISQIEQIEDCEQQCIMVDTDDGLYLTDHFIVTHNSTILPDILDALALDPKQVAFCAPTGKAAKVMGTKLRAQGINVYPSTIHSLIYTPKPQKAEALERELAEMKTFVVLLKAGDVSPPSGNLKADLHEAEKKIHILTRDLDRAYDLNDLRFSLNPDSRLVQDDIALIVVDEGSMVGEQMAEDLMDFEIPILVMGDPGQLPPVGEDPGFLNGTPDAFLTEVHRQAAENPIIHIATLVRKGQRPEYGDYGDGVLVIPAKKDIYTLDLDRDAQVIVGTNKNRWKQTSKMRKEGGYLDSLPHKGEPLIMCRNSRTYPNLVNGTQVYSDDDHGMAEDGRDRFLAKIRDEDGKQYSMFCYQGLLEEHFGRVKNFATTTKERAFRSRINDHQLDFGWAITCHKAQGSQWDEVIVHDDSGSFREDADKWLYTAVSRAAERLVLVT